MNHTHHVSGKLINLEPLAQEHLPFTRTLRNDDRVRVQFLTTSPITLDQHQEWFNKYLSKVGDYVFAIRSKELDRVIGQVSIYDIAGGHGEFGRLMIEPTLWHLGLGREATALAIKFAFETLGLIELRLVVKEDNLRAVRLYQSLGFRDRSKEDGMVSMVIRKYEIWDRPKVASSIDQIWLKDAAEHEHRKNVARIVNSELLGQELFMEIGCGSGQIAGYLFDFGLPMNRYRGLDISERMLELARFRFPNIQVDKGDIFKLPLGDCSMDVVGCFEVLCHIPEFPEPVAELVRVTKRLLIFTTWAREAIKKDTWTMGFEGTVAFCRTHGLNDVMAILARHNFRDVKVKDQGHIRFFFCYR